MTTESKKAKGVSKNVVKNQIQINAYIQIIQYGDKIFEKMYVFVSTLHTD